MKIKAPSTQSQAPAAPSSPASAAESSILRESAPSQQSEHQFGSASPQDALHAQLTGRASQPQGTKPSATQSMLAQFQRPVFSGESSGADATGVGSLDALGIQALSASRAQPAPEHVKDLAKTIKKTKTLSKDASREGFMGYNPKSKNFRASLARLKQTSKALAHAIGQKDYGKAQQHLETLRNGSYPMNDNKDGQGISPSDTGETFLSNLKGVDPELSQSLETLKEQMSFVEGMQKAGISDASLPPSEKQLKQYFSSLKNKPQEALEEFEKYTKHFHVHIGTLHEGKVDVKYNKGKGMEVPKSWKDVNHPKRNVDISRSAAHGGKHINDCEGFAYLAQELLGAAGFSTEHQMAFAPGAGKKLLGHAIAKLTHPQMEGARWVSNEEISSSQDAAARIGLGQSATKLEYFTGNSLHDAKLAASKAYATQ